MMRDIAVFEPLDINISEICDSLAPDEPEKLNVIICGAHPTALVGLLNKNVNCNVVLVDDLRHVQCDNAIVLMEPPRYERDLIGIDDTDDVKQILEHFTALDREIDPFINELRHCEINFDADIKIDFDEEVIIPKAASVRGELSQIIMRPYEHASPRLQLYG